MYPPYYVSPASPYPANEVLTQLQRSVQQQNLILNGLTELLARLERSVAATIPEGLAAYQKLDPTATQADYDDWLARQNAPAGNTGNGAVGTWSTVTLQPGYNLIDQPTGKVVTALGFLQNGRNYVQDLLSFGDQTTPPAPAAGKFRFWFGGADGPASGQLYVELLGVQLVADPGNPGGPPVVVVPPSGAIGVDYDENDYDLNDYA